MENELSSGVPEDVREDPKSQKRPARQRRRKERRTLRESPPRTVFRPENKDVMLDFMRRFRYEILRWLKDRLDTVEDPVDRIKL